MSSSLPQGFAFEDHTADMILHGYGPLIQDAFTQTAIPLFEMMSPGSCTQNKVAHKQKLYVNVTADTRERLLFQFLNELLGGIWGEKKILVGHIEILHFNRVLVQDEAKNENEENTTSSEVNNEEKKSFMWSLSAVVFGDEFDPAVHEIGTECKAITFHGVKVEETEEDMLYHCRLVVDI